MLHLPKKRPWVILVLLYVVIVTVWTTFIILAHQQGDHRTPEEAEAYIKEHPPTHGQHERNSHD